MKLTPDIIYGMSNDQMVEELMSRGVEFRDCINRPQLIRKLLNLIEVNDDIDKSRLPFDAQNVVEAKERTRFYNNPYGEGSLPPEAMKAADKVGTELFQSIAQDPELVRIMSDPVMREMFMKLQKFGPEAIKEHLSDPG